ncbi:MAG: hypothetical protein D6741_06460 [Planctomycetota bacterium]|nr:MAG: hypothetical protein D6741_06460 [Planctomycetota bacterium]
MSRIARWCYLWPGLWPLVRSTCWWGAVVALVFGAAFNLALAATILWPELLAPRVRTGLWFALGASWGLMLLWTAWWNHRENAKQSVDPDTDLFPKAQEAYLKGNWFEAERILAQLLRRNRRDVEAALLLATLWRRRGRLAEAGRLLARLSRLETAAAWSLEIEREQMLVARAETESPDSDGAEDDPESEAPKPSDSDCSPAAA